MVSYLSIIVKKQMKWNWSGKNLFDMARNTESILENSTSLAQSVVQEKNCYPNFRTTMTSNSRGKISSRLSDFGKKQQDSMQKQRNHEYYGQKIDGWGKNSPMKNKDIQRLTKNTGNQSDLIQSFFLTVDLSHHKLYEDTWIHETNADLQFLNFDAQSGPLATRCGLGMLVRKRNKYVMEEMEKRKMNIPIDVFLKVFKVSEKAVSLYVEQKKETERKEKEENRQYQIRGTRAEKKCFNSQNYENCSKREAEQSSIKRPKFGYFKSQAPRPIRSHKSPYQAGDKSPQRTNRLIEETIEREEKTTFYDPSTNQRRMSRSKTTIRKYLSPDRNLGKTYQWQQKYQSSNFGC